ncbi:MAG: TrgA family protein [Alphaproteobacteria bacterium]
MPTAAKLVAGIAMAIFGVIVIMVAVSVYPDLDRRASGMMTTAAIVGLIVGWRGLGRIIETDEGAGYISGLRSGLSAFLWVIGLFALDGMLAGILDHDYYQPMAAVMQIPIRMIIYGKMAMDPKILGTMLVLSVVAGKMAKNASRKWN